MATFRLRPAHAPSPQSLALAVALTAAMLAAALVAGISAPRSWWERGTRPVAERITYVAPVAPPVNRPVAPPLAHEPTAGTPGGRANAGPVPTAPAGTLNNAPTISAPQVAPVPAPGLPVDSGRTGRAGRAGASGPAAAAVRGPTIGPLRSGAELPAAPPLSRGQKDSVLKAFTRDLFGNPAVIAEAVRMAKDAEAHRRDEAERELGRTAGGGQPRAHGVQLTLVKIPFGGPSPEQRKRDSIVDADVRARLAAAADRRARQRADSLRRDSLRVIP